MNIRKTSVFYHVFTLTLSNIGLNLLGFLYRIFLSRMTGAEGMGVYQLMSMNSVPEYAAVNETVNMAKVFARGRERFVNGVLGGFKRGEKVAEE